MSEIDYILCFRIYEPSLQKFVYNRLKEELVEDIIQDVFVILWEKRFFIYERGAFFERL